MQTENLVTTYKTQKEEAETYLKQLLSQIDPVTQGTFWEYVARRERMFELKLEIIQIM